VLGICTEGLPGGGREGSNGMQMTFCLYIYYFQYSGGCGEYVTERGLWAT